MRHVAVGDMYIQELVRTKQVIIGKIDGKANPANTLTKHLATASEMLQFYVCVGQSGHVQLVDVAHTG